MRSSIPISKHTMIASRAAVERKEGESLLKGGIETRNAAYNKLIAQIERVAIASRTPILLTGPTGAGKSQLARRIYDLKKARHKLSGELVDVNCATIRGDSAMSALFGHTKGAFTGALDARQGLLRKANGGVLFLDEIGELGTDEQAMLLRAVEEKVFYPVGSDKEQKSDFQLVAGTATAICWRRCPRGASGRIPTRASISGHASGSRRSRSGRRTSSPTSISSSGRARSGQG